MAGFPIPDPEIWRNMKERGRRVRRMDVPAPEIPPATLTEQFDTANRCVTSSFWFSLMFGFVGAIIFGILFGVPRMLDRGATPPFGFCAMAALSVLTGAAWGYANEYLHMQNFRGGRLFRAMTIGWFVLVCSVVLTACGVGPYL